MTITSDDRNADQVAYWNGPGGKHWSERQQFQDVLLQPVSDILIDRIKATNGQRIVDIGCGCGATTLALATQVGPSGHLLGVDISEPMLARARHLTPKDAPIEFVQADATVYPFPATAFDRLCVAFRRDVFRAAGVVFRQHAQGVEIRRPRDIRLLARDRAIIRG